MTATLRPSSQRGYSTVSALRQVALSLRIGLAIPWKMRSFPKQSFSPSLVRRWLLVTSAYHMPRAIGVFRKAGFPVEPYPVDWRTRGAEDMMRPFAVMSDGLQR